MPAFNYGPSITLLPGITETITHRFCLGRRERLCDFKPICVRIMAITFIGFVNSTYLLFFVAALGAASPSAGGSSS